MKPIEANTLNKVCKLKRDNLSTKNFWILLDGGTHIVICKQVVGKPSEGSLTIPKSQFDRLVRWYVTGSPTPKGKANG